MWKLILILCLQIAVSDCYGISLLSYAKNNAADSFGQSSQCSKNAAAQALAADFGDSCWREASVAQSTGSIFSEAFLWRTFVYNFDFELPRLIFIPDVI